MAEHFLTNPPMGWNSFDCYGASVNESELLEEIDYMTDHLKEFGWEYIICDIQWYEPTADSSDYHPFADLAMDAYGRLIPAVNRFPSSADGVGFAAIAEYAHVMGLRFGIHMMRGIPRQAVHANCPIKGTNRTARQIAHTNSICSWNTDMYGIDTTKPGAQEYYNSLFELYAEWGVDYVKVDDICVKYAMGESAGSDAYGADEVEMIRKAIDACGRDIVLSLSPGPAFLDKAEHLKAHANLWRITGDFWDDWKDIVNMFDRCAEWAPHVGAGHFPDCDMLPLGHLAIRGSERGYGERFTRLTPDEQRTMISLWCIFRSPMMIGSELKDMDAATVSLLTNRDVLALLADSRGAKEAMRNGSLILWTASDCEDRDVRYAAIFNVGAIPQEYAIPFDKLGIEGDWCFTDLWSHEELGSRSGQFITEVMPHGVRLLRLYRDLPEDPDEFF